ncbi:DUF721 domain-containing protein [Rickettsia endosymbiont of Pantilius tunicatus]|uniref:DUF721 domain-containing protein n=1 Tax=unclassified Rickettsia TaxID=114295 RepID=UPI0030E42A8C
MKLIKDDVHKIVRHIFARQHPLLPEIMINWSKIVGFKFSDKALPLKIITDTNKKQKTNTLFVQAEDHATALEISFYQEIILERIAVYLGFKAIHQMRVTVYKQK